MNYSDSEANLISTWQEEGEGEERGRGGEEKGRKLWLFGGTGVGVFCTWQVEAWGLE